MAKRTGSIDYSGFESDGDEFNNRVGGDGGASSGGSSASIGGDSAGNDGERPDQRDVGDDLIRDSGREAEAGSSGNAATGGSERIRFSVGNAIFGDGDGDSGNGDGGDRTRAGEESRTGSVRRTRKAARAALADEPHEETGSKPVSKSKAKGAGGKKLTQTEAEEVAEGLLQGVGFVAAKVVENDDAHLTDDEIDDLLPHMTRIMMRMSPAAAKRYRDLSDPLFFAMAIYFYLARIAPLYQEKRLRDAYERARFAEQYPADDSQSVSDMDNNQPPPNPQNGFGRGRGFSG